ncbi:membrane dipeptidase, partial [Methylobacterium radiotolerans]
IGVLVDLSHVAPTTMRHALEVATRPVMVSHSGAGRAAAVCASRRAVSHPHLVADDRLGGLRN